MQFSICFHCPFLTSKGCSFPYVFTVVSQNCRHDLPHVVIAIFQKAVDLVFPMLSLLFNEKMDVIFYILSHSQSSECSFPCAATSYLVSSGWISRNVSTAVLLSSGCRFLHVVTVLFQKAVDGFSCVVTAHSISSGWISICCQCCYHYVSLYVVTNQ